MTRYADISPKEHEQEAPEIRRGLAFRPMDLGWQDQEAKFWDEQTPRLDEYASGHFGHLNGLAERANA